MVQLAPSSNGNESYPMLANIISNHKNKLPLKHEDTYAFVILFKNIDTSSATRSISNMNLGNISYLWTKSPAVWDIAKETIWKKMAI